MMTDPIADMLTRIRNAGSTNKDAADVPASKVKLEIARLLKEEGYIKDYKYIKQSSKGVIRIYLKYTKEKELAIKGIRRISHSGRRVYAGKDEIPRVLGGLGVAIISTSKGIMTSRQSLQEGVGGEVICYVW
ncbi:MAG: 30S ribosomal protein S8 [Candidatus Wallbacteria bacterium]|nr:30S ribosomal protein S8 [Candidatus Wallbacteria bacterium]